MRDRRIILSLYRAIVSRRPNDMMVVVLFQLHSVSPDALLTASCIDNLYLSPWG